MDNDKKYKFADFTIDNYRKMVQLAIDNRYEFRFFTDPPVVSQKCVLWRHDVEFSPQIALRMAEIERDLGVRATYFFQLHCEFYNVLERDVSDILIKIKAMGHDIGLHFDSHYFGVSDKETLERCLHLDADYFQKIFDLKLEVFSFHNTNEFILSCEDEHYSGLINVYSKKIKTKYSYCTDSTGFWRYEPLYDVLKNPNINRLHVLVHDAMWSEHVMSPRGRVFNSIEKSAQIKKAQYDSILKEFGAKNVDSREIL